MIITITLNPAIDKTIELNRFSVGRLNKVENSILDPGGKGINVSKVIESLGGNSIATGFLGGSSGHYIEKSLKELTIQSDFVQIEGETRTNLKIFDRMTKETTEINEPGPYVSEEDVIKLTEKVQLMIRKPCIVVISGSAPKSIGSDVFQTLVEVCQGLGADVFLDTYDAGFRAGLKAKPTFIKPNKPEVESYLGHEIRNDEDLKLAGRHFMDMGIKHVFITLGKEGAFYCNSEKYVKLHSLKVDVHSTVGAGDAFVGGFIYALDHEYDIDESLRLAVATSAGAVMTVGTKPMNMEWIMSQIDRVGIELI